MFVFCSKNGVNKYGINVACLEEKVVTLKIRSEAKKQGKEEEGKNM